ncbi:MAG: hypothetical protein EXQ58_06040 [Acidobacteria bacterium]|nr:hypothetical protein [Acidobacteriota bacterium]
MRPEYDFSKACSNRYAKRYPEGASLVVIDPALRKHFPDSASVNAALRSLVLVAAAGRLKLERRRRA